MTYPATSLICAAIDDLVTRFRAALPDVKVSDGLFLKADRLKRLLEVGVEDPEGTTGDAARSTLDWAAVGRMARDENLEIFCMAQAWDGSQNWKKVRDSAMEIVTACDAELVSASSPGQTRVAGSLWGRVDQVGLRWGIEEDGSVVAYMPFRISIRGRVVPT